MRSRNSSSDQFGARRADDREALGQQAPARERVERREDLALGEVARGAEDDHRARLGGPPGAEAGEQRVLGELGLDHRVFTACPPNSARRAALTLAANDSSCRDAKRMKSAIVMAGAGTSSLIAASTVQRPSPESAT